MTQPPRHATLRTAELRQLEQLTTQFVNSWRACGPRDKAVSLAAYLPPQEDPLRLAALDMLIPIDLEHRWARRDRVLLEDYLNAYPELGSAGDLPAEIILAEHHIRAAHGDTPAIETYRQRFPRQFANLQNILDRPARTRGTLCSEGDVTVVPAQNSTPNVTPVPPPTLAPNLSGSSRKIVPIGDGYQLLECIGRGAYGEVWRATAPGGVEVAIKLIKWTSSNSLTQVELRALELMKRLRHAFLSQVQAYWLAEDHLYIVMDLADGSLQQRFDECHSQGLTGIPAEELLGYMREAAEALDYLHSNQVLHRDVKPANILLSSGHARLADFGLARLFRDEKAELSATVIGTPLYMGPEVWEQKVGPSSDQYSLASTYVELRLGRALFEATTQIEVMKKHLSMRPDLQPLPAKEQRVLHQALAKKGTERYPSCAEFVAELHAAVTGNARPAKSGPARRRLLAFGMLICLAAGVAMAGLSWSGFQFKLVAPAPTILPPEYEPAAGAIEVFVAPEGVKYWNRIVRKLPNKAVLPSGMPCEFVLVPYHAEQRLPSFYILKNKVWNELFAEFNHQHLRIHPEMADAEKWPLDWAERGADKDHGVDMPAASHPRHPVMRVGYQQAKEFAKWLGGSLPSPRQWDAAAGLYSVAAKKDGGIGPFRGDWNSNPRPKVAVASGETGTAPVGASDDDVSPFSCRDMAGNGAEWTSEATAGGYSTVTLRGRDYHKERPLLYYDLLAEDSTEIEKEDPYYTSDHIGFRVVVDPSQGAMPASDSDEKSGPR